MLASATFQIISAVVAVLGFLFGIVRWRDATRARDETRELQKREQANKVHAWAEKRTGDERLVVVENASDAPVHDVKAWLVRPGTALPAGGVPDKKPTTQRTHLLANSSLEYPLRTTGSAPEKRPPVVVTFTDAEGQPWLRDADGRLTKPNAR